MDNGVGRLWRCLDNAIAMHEFLMASGENVLVADVTGDGVSFEHHDRVFRLDSATKEALERAFDADFSMVNIHLGPDADRLTDEYEAAAVTIGNEIYFAAGNYAPDTEAGAALLRHELQHVVQFQRRMPMVYAEDIVDLEAEAIYVASLSADRESEQRVGEMAMTGTIFERSDGGGGQTALTKKRGGDSGGATLNDWRDRRRQWEHTARNRSKK